MTWGNGVSRFFSERLVIIVLVKMLLVNGKLGGRLLDFLDLSSDLLSPHLGVVSLLETGPELAAGLAVRQKDGLVRTRR